MQTVEKNMAAKRPAVNGRYSGVESEGSGGPSAVDRALKKNTPAAGKSYDVDAEAIAKVLVRHYGDEADAVLKRTLELLGNAWKGKR